MSGEHSVYSAHEAQEMLSSTREMSKSVRHAQTEKHQLLQVCQSVSLSVSASLHFTDLCLLSTEKHFATKIFFTIENWIHVVQGCTW